MQKEKYCGSMVTPKTNTILLKLVNIEENSN